MITNKQELIAFRKSRIPLPSNATKRTKRRSWSSPRKRPQAREMERGSAPSRMRLFVIYARDDEKRIHPLSERLTILGRRGYIQVWQDTQLIAGEEWKHRILEEIAKADIVLLLYSTASRASEFIQEIEAPIAMERTISRDNPCTLIVVPLDRNDWDTTVSLELGLNKLQTATWNAKPVLDFSPQRNGWLEVEHSIREAVDLRRRGRCQGKGKVSVSTSVQFGPEPQRQEDGRSNR